MHKYVSYEKKNYIKAPQTVGDLFEKLKRKCDKKNGVKNRSEKIIKKSLN